MFRNNKGILHNRASLKTGLFFVRPIQGRNNKQNKVIKCKTKKTEQNMLQKLFGQELVFILLSINYSISNTQFVVLHHQKQ